MSMYPRAAMFYGCALALALSACQHEVETISSDEIEIIGGSTVSAGQFPTVAGIIVDQGRRGICTGTLVGPDLVITAAHCITPSVLGFGSQSAVTAATVVTIDQISLGQGGMSSQAAETIPYPNFRSPGDPDIGIIRLTTPFTGREYTPVNLQKGMVPDNSQLTMVGFGASNGGGGGAGTNRFLQSKTTIACNNYGVSDARFICFSQTDGTGKCSGDSGGPSFMNIDGVQHLVGITSFGDQTCQQFGADQRTDADEAFQFLDTNAPELVCGKDGQCQANCGTGGLPVDPDCPNCTNDDDCTGSDEFCSDDGFCTPEPLTPGGLGSPCGPGEPECASGICGSGPDGMRCTDTCDTTNNDCPSGFDCLGAAGAGGACWPGEESGGCSAGGNGNAGGLLFVLVALAFLRRRQSA